MERPMPRNILVPLVSFALATSACMTGTTSPNPSSSATKTDVGVDFRDEVRKEIEENDVEHTVDAFLVDQKSTAAHIDSEILTARGVAAPHLRDEILRYVRSYAEEQGVSVLKYVSTLRGPGDPEIAFIVYTNGGDDGPVEASAFDSHDQ